MKKTTENVMTAEIATTEISLNESQVIENKGEIEMTNENTNNTEITAIETVDTVNAENVIEEKKTSQKTKKSNAEKIANQIKFALVDETGKYAVVLDTDYETAEKYNYAPYTYLVNKDYSLKYVAKWFVDALLKN